MVDSSAKRSGDGSGPPTEVLIIDNDQSHAETVAEGLQRAGFACRVATSGTQGARMIEEGNYDVVITDLIQGCYNVWAWSDDPKSRFILAWVQAA